MTIDTSLLKASVNIFKIVTSYNLLHIILPYYPQDLTRQVERTDESSGSQPGSCPSSPRTSHQGNSPHHISSSPLRGNMISGKQFFCQENFKFIHKISK